MNRRDEIKRIWSESFGDSREYVDMYFSRVYRDEDALTLDIDGKPVSSLLLQPYKLRFHGSEQGMSYIAGAATRRSSRGNGYMAMLMATALKNSAERGDLLCSLIPGSTWLYDYYRRFGFSTVFFNDRQRFTSLHEFSASGDWEEVDDNYSEEVSEAFMRFEHEKECGVLHTRRDFLNILDDLHMDGGIFVALREVGHPDIKAMAWAVEDEQGNVVVKKIMSENELARKAVLNRIRAACPDAPIAVMADPSECGERYLCPFGMGRIVNVEKTLSAIAAANHRLTMKVRVKDPIIEENNATFTVADGICRKLEERPEKLDFDVDIPTFTSIVFSSATTGNLLEFPSCRPDLYLMLE